MATISRRGFLLAAAGAAGAVLGGRRPAWASAAVADVPGLSPRRAATMRGLVATLRHAPGGRFAAGGARGARARFTPRDAPPDAGERPGARAAPAAVRRGGPGGPRPPP